MRPSAVAQRRSVDPMKVEDAVLLNLERLLIRLAAARAMSCASFCCCSAAIC